ncbi:hypothetical protein IE81DRAFT_324215 [Ceraceosorus guamensis]|uniref:Uncharacterized protein n=1 Tax=Ceraceosorus guamensis TaxID=1522189 RepID=A0A316W223_9BASI|nr:hypothetical protein IE81DRAFT_324215 [Ceraceosorus guamensis]PWN41725.1 hypothetical protein IE81DRAFT_324215 [Ceraceosorus guamensis]
MTSASQRMRKSSAPTRGLSSHQPAISSRDPHQLVAHLSGLHSSKGVKASNRLSGRPSSSAGEASSLVQSRPVPNTEQDEHEFAGWTREDAIEHLTDSAEDRDVREDIIAGDAQVQQQASPSTSSSISRSMSFRRWAGGGEAQSAQPAKHAAKSSSASGGLSRFFSKRKPAQDAEQLVSRETSAAHMSAAQSGRRASNPSGPVEKDASVRTFEFPLRSSIVSAKGSQEPTTSQAGPSAEGKRSTQGSHGPSKSVPVVDVAALQQSALKSDPDLRSTASGPSQPRQRPSQTSSLGSVQERRRRTSLAGRFGSLFIASNADAPPSTAQMASYDTPHSAPTHQQAHSASSIRTAFPARLRSLSFARRTGTTSNPTSPGRMSFFGFGDLAANAGTSDDGTRSDAASHRRKLSLRLRAPHLRAQEERMPLTPEIDSWRAPQRRASDEEKEELSDEEAVRVQRTSREGVPAARSSSIDGWVEAPDDHEAHKRAPLPRGRSLDSARLLGHRSTLPRSSSHDTKAGLQTAGSSPSNRRRAPPRFLETPDLAGPLDPRALMRQAGVSPLSSPNMSVPGSRRTSEGTAKGQMIPDEASSTALLSDQIPLQADTQATPRASLQALQDVTPRRRQGADQKFDGLGLTFDERNDRVAAREAASADAKSSLEGQSGGADSLRRGRAFVADLSAWKWEGTGSEIDGSDGRDTPGTIHSRRRPDAPTPHQWAAERSNGSARTDMRPYSLISTDTDGGDTPIMKLRRLVVDTETEGEEASLFFRPPGTRSNSAPSSTRDVQSPRSSPDRESRNGTPPVPELTPAQAHAANIRRMHMQQGLEEDARTSPVDELAELRFGNVDHGRVARHKRTSTTLSAGGRSKRASTQESDAGATDTSALDAQVSQARRMAAVPLGRAKVAEWAGNAASSGSAVPRIWQAPQLEACRTARHGATAPTPGGSPSTTAHSPEAPDQVILGPTQSPSLRSPNQPSRQVQRSAPTQVTLDEAARLGKAPSKRVRRSRSQPMSSSVYVPKTPTRGPAALSGLPTSKALPSLPALPPAPSLRISGKRNTSKGRRHGMASQTNSANQDERALETARTLRPSQSGNLREGTFTFRAEVPSQEKNAPATLLRLDTLRKSASAGPLSDCGSHDSKGAADAHDTASTRATIESPTKSRRGGGDGGSRFEKRPERTSRREEGHDRSRSKGSLRRGKSFATSEEAAQAMRQEQADREKRHREKEQKREERRRQDHAKRKQNDPLLATRLALMGLAGPMPAGEGSEAADDVASAATAAHDSPERMVTPLGWELRREPLRPITVSSPPASNEEVLIAEAPSLRAEMRQTSRSTPYSESILASTVDSRTSFKTAEEYVRRSADGGSSDSEAETLHQRSAIAERPSRPVRDRAERQPALVSPPPARPVSSATMATVTSTGTSFALLDFPKPPSRQAYAEVSDDGTVLSLAHLSSSRAIMNVAPGAARLPENAYPEREQGLPSTSPAYSKGRLLDLHGHSRPVSGRLGDSPRGQLPELVSLGLPSPALRSQHASIISQNAPPP